MIRQRRLTLAASRFTAIALVSAVAATTLALPQPASAAIPADVGACVNGWQEVPVPDAAFLSTPFEILTRDGQEAWILGGSNKGLLALRNEGGAWQQRATGTGGHRGLTGGAVLGREKILGVGYYRPFKGEGEGSLKPVSGRVVKSDWKRREVPDPPGPRATLTDVESAGKGRAWAVGTRLQDGRLRAYALLWDGKRWRRKDPPAGSGSGLLAVGRSPGGDTWAVGWKEASLGRPRPYIVKRKNGRWKAVKTAPLSGGPAVLTDLAFRSDGVGYAVGYHDATGNDRQNVILQRWDGRSWSGVNLPWAGDFAALPRSISAGDDGQVWIAGTQLANDQREPRGFIAHLQDGTWEVDVLDVPADLRSEVMAVTATSSGAVAAASVGASLLVLKSCAEDAAVASKGKRVVRGKVKVRNLKARRASLRRDQPYFEEGPVATDPAASGAFSLAGAVTIAAPVRDKAFEVRNMARQSGLKQVTRTYDGLVADFDGDGSRDVFYSRHGIIKPRLALNGPGGFTDGPTDAFGSVDRHGCDAADVDNDGRRDILCAVGASRGLAVKRHELSLAPATDARRLALDGLGISDPLGRGRHVALFRLDGDPFPEAFVANAPDRDDGMPSYSRFYRNEGGTFRPAPGVGLDTTHGAECVLADDVDKDGDQDLVYCAQYGFDGRSAGLRFMRNEKGVLRDRTKARKIVPIGDIDVAFADVTGDRRKDLIQLSSSRLRVSKWTRKGYRKIYEARLSDAWALAAGDASGDGRADIYIVRGNDDVNKTDLLLVSRRKGTSFTSVRIPQTKKGTADDVFALDYDQNGHVDFVVLNGRQESEGPVQLLASFPRD